MSGFRPFCPHDFHGTTEEDLWQQSWGDDFDYFAPNFIRIRPTKGGYITSVYGVECVQCHHTNHMPYECLPKDDSWDTLDCDSCGTSLEYRGWQNGPDVDYHIRKLLENVNGK